MVIKALWKFHLSTGRYKAGFDSNTCLVTIMDGNALTPCHPRACTPPPSSYFLLPLQTIRLRHTSSLWYQSIIAHFFHYIIISLEAVLLTEIFSSTCTTSILFPSPSKLFKHEQNSHISTYIWQRAVSTFRSESLSLIFLPASIKVIKTLGFIPRNTYWQHLFHIVLRVSALIISTHNEF